MRRRKRDDPARIGATIRQLREREELTREELSEAAGINETTLWRIEAGRSRATVESLRGIAQALDVDLSRLLR